MVFSLSRSQIAPREDPHNWNSWDHYRTIHDIRLSEHPFVIDDTLVFSQEGEGVISLRGMVRCPKSVVLEVEKWFESQYFGSTLRIRCRIYRYIAWKVGGHLLLKYHNLHRDSSEYHHRLYHPSSGREMFHEVLERYQFPTFPEVLDELEIIAQDL
jgi:hypothetical protein